MRYALLRHDCPADYRDGPHWDLMIERPGLAIDHRLATWSLLALPAEWLRLLRREGAASDDAVECVRLADHRAAYLDYEGPLSGDRGNVARWAGGECRVVESSDTRWRVELLAPSPLAAVVTLTHAAGERWRLERS
ncbi:MAG: hypothetical protein ACRCT8_03360 [Lacipirellulaceae bacterium]